MIPKLKFVEIEEGKVLSKKFTAFLVADVLIFVAYLFNISFD